MYMRDFIAATLYDRGFIWYVIFFIVRMEPTTIATVICVLFFDVCLFRFISFRFVSFVVSWCTHPMFLPIVQDNRLRVERDELQHAAQEAEKTAALRKEVLRAVVGHPHRW